MIWSYLPDIQIGRETASSCCNGGYIYLFGGFDGGWHTNSIERLSLSYLRAKTTFQPGQASEWELIEPSEESVLIASWSGMVSLNDTEFLILGGDSRP